jgi:Family of unknown function (DUF6325)
MGPLQYMVVAFEPEHFKTEIIPELKYLTNKSVIRIVDLLFVSRSEDGLVMARELSEVMAAEDTRFCASQVDDSSEWFTQDDIDVAGSTLPNGASVALILFEHKWAVRLDDAVTQVNTSAFSDGAEPRAIAAEIEHLLVLGSGSGVSYCSTNTSI